MRLEHVNLTVSAIDRSVDFYCRLLGLHVRWRGSTTGGRPAVHVGTDDWYIAMFEGEANPVSPDYDHAGFNHFGVVVDDLAAAKLRLAELDTPVILEGTEYAPGKQVYCYDPDGHEVELIEYPPAY